jgi:V/A-type H+-transporting ATPase subunit D
MAEIKMTKNELRDQQSKLNQLLKYLPTLQLKKALLQVEVAETRHALEAIGASYAEQKKVVDDFSALFAQSLYCDISPFTRVEKIEKTYENIAGAEVPIFTGCTFASLTYNFFDTPIWLEGAIAGIQKLNTIEAHRKVMHEKLLILEKELREVSIRVNLFEKVLIPRCEQIIKKIKVFLGDQLLAAVSQAKVAKTKILERQEQESYAY